MMENNQKDFMKNRPVAAQANQYKDVYGSQKSSTRTTVSAVLTVIDFIILTVALVTRNNLMIVMFAPLFIILLISFFVAKHADKQNRPIEPQDNPEAIFKDHDI